jgi:hypothetical protein
MKKLILTSACVLAAAGAAFAQGSVQWSSISFSDFTAQTNTTVSSYLSGSKALTGGTIGNTVGASAGSFYYELLYTASGTAAPTTLAGLDNWSDSGLEGESATSSTAGRAQVLPSQSSTGVNGPAGFGNAAGTLSIDVILVGWSANLGTTWSAASTVLNSPSALASVVGLPLFGQSSIGVIEPDPSGTIPGAAIFGAPGIVSLLTPLYPVVVPEPTTLALGAMGVASLLALRRKKA